MLQRQKRDWIINSFKIQENSKGPFPHKLGTIKIDKNFTIFQIEGQGVKEEPVNTLQINEETGVVHVLKPVDYEAFPMLKGLGRVKEGEENVTVFRLHVQDEDEEGTKAWKAKYKIHGDSKNNFKIITDSESNDGLLIVEKHLDYEDSSEKKLNITVENEMPFYSCKVKTRKDNDLWVVMTDNKEKSQPPYPVTVHVEDVNDAPVLHPSNEKVPLKENTEKGRHLITFTAEDHEKGAANKIVFKKEADPADWVTVDPKSGKVTSSRPVDRESSFVKNNTYIVNIIAVDNGKPPMTGTATLTILIIDDNDNAPYLPESTIDICQSDKPSKAILKAIDLDEGVYSGPFSYTLLGDVKGKWSIDPPQGYSVNLVKESKVHSGHYELQLKCRTCSSSLLSTTCQLLCVNAQTQKNQTAVCANLLAPQLEAHLLGSFFWHFY
nr:B-cadherin-like [Labrus bergylta]